ncbi:GNAT family N-acetyltransferase [Actibacterium sp. 188UL27-1]|uniref:GNAT family N-acetyltransferase n=1 Tax=Actibacterium sp. 188UL27-1 TaxID=2786961 RepID=UPI00195EE566|nr:GNAT family N-acetyltransferase [Actibacterium sp. 188UL27-1]MBM7066246.1 GNAT family N-acetyltransferase [Actibacterium sp. 188UL27-1]
MTSSPFSIPVLETDRLRLRALAEGDFPVLAEFYASDRARFVGGPADADRAWRTLATEIGHWTLRGYGRFGVEIRETGAFAGIVGPWNPHGWPEPELGWDLMNGFEGHGYASEAAKAAREWVYGTLGWTTAVSLIAEGNLGSEGVARRLGCIRERDYDHAMFGTMGIWRHPGPDA